MQYYCPACGKRQETIVVRKKETYPVRGEPITIIANVCTCACCGEEIMTIECDDENLRRAYAKYRAKHGLLQPKEIKALRQRLGVSAEEFAKMTHVDCDSILRYERGSLQTAADNQAFLWVERCAYPDRNH